MSTDGRPADADTWGLTAEAARAAVAERADVPGRPPASTKTEHSICRAIDYLQERGEATGGELRTFFTSHGVSAPQQGQYVEARQWWSDVGDPALRTLPGVEADESVGYRFAADGVDPDAFDPEHVVPLSEIRDRLRPRVERVLDEHRVPLRGRDGRAPRQAFVDLVRDVRERGPLTSADIRGLLYDAAAVKRYDRRFDADAFLAEREDVLTALLDREEDVPRAPGDIPVSSYADVLAAEEEVAREPVTRWSVPPEAAQDEVRAE
ncbi:hypothetical protein [Halorarum salinum]|uniref:Uncharacterized protein n=1 Tax=Halorarum salinum TaxID=2743089 RepID=A0A7D5QE51_9EURY|nr:hypothetical protein [Halobaculum salinum]QLG62641.1 hypothetical protein HUG12_13270 [Halobaculum salinum]